MIPINKNRIVQKQATTSVLEFIAGEAIRPGMIVQPEYCSSLDDFTVVHYNCTTEPSNVAVAVEQTLDGRDVNDEISQGDRVSVAYLAAGDVFLGIAGSAITKGSTVALNNVTTCSAKYSARGIALDGAAKNGELVPILIR